MGCGSPCDPSLEENAATVFSAAPGRSKTHLPIACLLAVYRQIAQEFFLKESQDGGIVHFLEGGAAQRAMKVWSICRVDHDR